MFSIILGGKSGCKFWATVNYWTAQFVNSVVCDSSAHVTLLRRIILMGKLFDELWLHHNLILLESYRLTLIQSRIFHQKWGQNVNEINWKLLVRNQIKFFGLHISSPISSINKLWISARLVPVDLQQLTAVASAMNKRIERQLCPLSLNEQKQNKNAESETNNENHPTQSGRKRLRPCQPSGKSFSYNIIQIIFCSIL